MTYAPKIQGDFALNQIVVHLALVTRSIAEPGNPAMTQPISTYNFINGQQRQTTVSSANFNYDQTYHSNRTIQARTIQMAVTERIISANLYT